MSSEIIHVIGIGNRTRCDDAAGLEVVRQLKMLPVEGIHYLELTDGGIQLLDMWDSTDSVIIVDAVRSGFPAGHIHRFDAHRNAIPHFPAKKTTHSFGLGDIIELGRNLQRLPRNLIVYGIEGVWFEYGIRLSPAVETSVGIVAKSINEALRTRVVGNPITKIHLDHLLP